MLKVKYSNKSSKESPNISQNSKSMKFTINSDFCLNSLNYNDWNAKLMIVSKFKWNLQLNITINYQLFYNFLESLQ